MFIVGYFLFLNPIQATKTVLRVFIKDYPEIYKITNDTAIISPICRLFSVTDPRYLNILKTVETVFMVCRVIREHHDKSWCLFKKIFVATPQFIVVVKKLKKEC